MIVLCFLLAQRKEKNLNFHKSANNSKSRLNKNLTKLNLQRKLTLKCKRRILPLKRLKSQSLKVNLKKSQRRNLLRNQEKRQKRNPHLLS